MLPPSSMCCAQFNNQIEEKSKNTQTQTQREGERQRGIQAENEMGCK